MEKDYKSETQGSIDDNSIQKLEECNPLFAHKRHLLIITFTIRNLFLGIQYSIILSSAWKYLHALGASKWFYGLTIGTYPASMLLFSPLVGTIYSRTRRIKHIVTALTLIQMAGNLLYALPYSKWLPFVGRCLTGIGEAGTSLAYEEIKSTTQGDYKVKACTFIMVGFMVGIFCSPLLNLLFSRFDFYLGNWHINNKNAPAVFCAVMWLAMIVIIQLMLTDVARKYIDVTELEEKKTVKPSEERYLKEGDRDSVFYDDHTDDVFYDDDQLSDILDNERGTLMDYLKNLTFFEIGAIYYSSVISWLILFQNETLIPLVTQVDFSWNVIDTSIVYVIGAVYTTSLYVIFGLLGKKMSDLSSLILVQCISMLASALLVVYQSYRDDFIISRFLFTIFLCLAFTNEPLNSVSASSLLTKATPSYLSEIALKYRLKTTLIGNTIGPVWGSLLFDYINIYSSVNSLLSLTALVWLCLSLERLRVRLFLFNAEPPLD